MSRESLIDVDFTTWRLCDHGAHERAVAETKQRIAAGDAEPRGGWETWAAQRAADLWAAAERESYTAWAALRV